MLQGMAAVHGLDSRQGIAPSSRLDCDGLDRHDWGE